MTARLLIVGSSGHAGVVADAVERAGGCEIAGFVDSFRAAGERAFGYPVIGGEDEAGRYAREHGPVEAVVAIGDNYQRRRMAERLQERVPGLAWRTVVHPAACVSPRATLGPGTVVLAGAIVCAGARVGSGCLLNTGCSLDHDSTMGDYASLGPGAVTGGNVVIGEASALAIGAVVLQGRRIGARAVVGAGAVVIRDVPELAVAYGVPARTVRARLPSDPYL